MLMRLDVSKLDMKNKNVHRTDGDFAVTWAKMYGKGRVYYTTLGHVEENWDKPEFQQMITEAIAWAMGLENADIDLASPATTLVAEDGKGPLNHKGREGSRRDSFVDVSLRVSSRPLWFMKLGRLKRAKMPDNFDHAKKLCEDACSCSGRDGNSLTGFDHAQRWNWHLQLSQSFHGRDDRPVERSRGAGNRNVPG